MFFRTGSQTFIRILAFLRRWCCCQAAGRRDMETGPGPMGTVSFSKCRCPAREGQLEMWRPCANQCVGPSGPGAYFHYQGHIPEILWGPGTYYRRIKMPKENTHLRPRPGFFIFVIGCWVCPSWGCRRKSAAGQSVSMGVQLPMGEAGRHLARAAGPPTRPSRGHAGHPLPLISTAKKSMRRGQGDL